MSEEDAITVWIDQLSQGDRSAADRIWQEYFSKLVGYARRKLQNISAGRSYDEEDVALSAMHSLCHGMEEGRLDGLEGREELWKLLLTITARKIYAQQRKEKRLKRGGGKVRGESVFGDAADQGERAFGIADVLGAEPTPELAAEVAETTEELLQSIDDERARQIVLLRLEGYHNTEIAEKLNCARRTVERKLEALREAWNASSEAELQL